MENQALQFRTATFGGFQKQDVLNYLEKSAKDTENRISDLQKKLKEVEDTYAGMEGQLASAKEKIAQLEAEKAQLAEDLAGREESLAMSIKRCDGLEEQLKAAKGDLDSMAPAAEAYRELKERAAGIELAAHARAQAVEDEGLRKVARAERELLGWIDQTMATYATLRGELNSLLNAAAEEFQRTGEQVRGLSSELVGREEALEAIRGKLNGGKPLEDNPFKPRTATGGAVETGLFGRLRQTGDPDGPTPFTK